MACIAGIFRVLRLVLCFLLVFDCSLSIERTSDANGAATRDTDRSFHDSVEAKLDRIMQAIEDMEGVELECDITMKHVETIHEETKNVKRLLRNVPDIRLVNEGHRSRILLLEVPETFDTCVELREGKQVDSPASKLACLQKVVQDFVPDSDDNKRSKHEYQSMSHENDDDMQINNETPRLKSRGNHDRHHNQSTSEENKKSSAAEENNQSTPEGNDQSTSGEIRIRKEYRSLSDTERKKFHKAMKSLFDNGVVAHFGRLHSVTSYSAHQGVAFLPWHRCFIKKFEDELRKVDPTVTLPYWDCTFDAALKNPQDSILWTDEYFGNMVGDVTSGIAGGWTSARGNLHRYCAKGFSLPKIYHFKRIMEHCYIKDVSFPSGLSQTFEQLHNDVHAWVGGDMSAVGTAAYDPLFYLMHCHFDYMWEKFRKHQREKCSVDPATDYPDLSGTNKSKRSSHHHAEDLMDGMPEFRNIDGISDSWTNTVYRYEPGPTCANDCGGSDLLYCDRKIDYCVAKSRPKKSSTDDDDGRLAPGSVDP